MNILLIKNLDNSFCLQIQIQTSNVRLHGNKWALWRKAKKKTSFVSGHESNFRMFLKPNQISFLLLKSRVSGWTENDLPFRMEILHTFILLSYTRSQQTLHRHPAESEGAISPAAVLAGKRTNTGKASAENTRARVHARNHTSAKQIHPKQKHHTHTYTLPSA